MPMRLAFSALLFTTAVAAATFSPSNPLTHVKYGPSGITAGARVASNGHGFVGVWQTYRDQRVTRVASGESNIGVPIGQGSGSAAIAASGDHYIVAAVGSHGLEATFVDAAANPIGDAVPVEADASAPTVSAFGDLIGLAYLRYTTSGTHLEAALLSRMGSIIKKGIALKDDWFLDGKTYDVATSAQGMAVVIVSPNTGVRVMILDNAGNVVTTTPLEQPWPWDEPPFDSAIASDGHGYVVLWTGRGGILRAASLDASGAILRAAIIAPSKLFTSTAQPAIAFDGQQYVCGYLEWPSSQSQQLGPGVGYVTRIDSLLSVAPPRSLQTETAVSNISISAANGSSMVAWADRGLSAHAGGLLIAGAGQLHAAMVTADGLGVPFPIAITASEQLAPSAASNGSETLVAWNEETSNTNAIMVGLLDGIGRWKEVGLLAQQQLPTPLLVASNGSDFLVVWRGGAMRFASDGVRLDPQPLVMPPSFVSSSAVWDGHRYVISGDSYGAYPMSAAAVVTIEASGAVGAVHVVRPPKDGDFVSNPMLSWSGNGFLMTFVWSEPPCIGGVDPCFSSTGAHALPLTAAFEPGTEIPIGPTDAVLSTAVAWNGSEFLAAVIDFGAPFATRISSDGKSLGTVRLGTSAKFEKLGPPSIALNGADFLVAWRGADSSPANNYLIEVYPDGSVSALSVIDTSVATSDLVLVADAGRQLLVSSRAVDAAPYYGASRVTIQTTNETTPGSASKLTSALEGSLFTLQWTPVVNATEYRAEYRADNDPWSELDLQQGLATSLTVRLQSNTSRFEFRVRGWSADGAFPYSNVVSIALPRRRAM